jgi:hypothetical protein
MGSLILLCNISILLGGGVGGVGGGGGGGELSRHLLERSPLTLSPALNTQH